ncbi:MAG: hypothetical protein ACPG5B_08515 [Chitinophagales bacterium]
MIKYTENTLKQLQQILKEGGYQVRKGKGAFNTGYCILEKKKVIVLNRYHSTEAQIYAIMDILSKIELKVENLPSALKKLYAKVLVEKK